MISGHDDLSNVALATNTAAQPSDARSGKTWTTWRIPPCEVIDNTTLARSSVAAMSASRNTGLVVGARLYVLTLRAASHRASSWIGAFVATISAGLYWVWKQDW